MLGYIGNDCCDGSCGVFDMVVVVGYNVAEARVMGTVDATVVVNVSGRAMK